MYTKAGNRGDSGAGVHPVPEKKGDESVNNYSIRTTENIRFAVQYIFAVCVKMIVFSGES